MLTVAGMGRGKICQNLADVICERSLSKIAESVPCVLEKLHHILLEYTVLPLGRAVIENLGVSK